VLSTNLKQGVKMKFWQIILLFLTLVVVVNGGKVTFGANGKANIKQSKYPVKGCTQGGLAALEADKNSSSSSSSCGKLK
jgi:hypothetical protein